MNLSHVAASVEVSMFIPHGLTSTTSITVRLEQWCSATM